MGQDALRTGRAGAGVVRGSWCSWWRTAPQEERVHGPAMKGIRGRSLWIMIRLPCL